MSRPGDVELVLAAVLNGQETGEYVYAVRRPSRGLMVAAEDLRRLRLVVPEDVPEDEGLVALSDLVELSYSIDDKSQALVLDVDAGRLREARVSASMMRPPSPVTSDTGGFLNYDVVGRVGDAEKTSLSAVIEAGLFTPRGLGAASVLARTGGPQGAGVVRLDSTWTINDVERLRTWRIGDAVTGGSAVRRPVRFGGLQWSSNFALDPSFVAFPLPTASGVALLPSVVDVYVNGLRQFSTGFPTGPFEVTDIPVVTGRGEVEMVVKDLLGREQQVSLPYYAADELLRPGLSSFTLEVGAVRENYGTESFDYGFPFAGATYRLGLRERLTVEADAELSTEHGLIGAGFSTLIADAALLEVAGSVTLTDAGAGWSGALALSHEGPRLSLGGRVKARSAHHTDLAGPPQSGTNELELQLNAGYRFDSFSVSGMYLRRQDAEGGGLDALSGSLNTSIGDLGFASLWVTHSRPHAKAQDGSTTVGLGFTIPLGERTNIGSYTTVTPELRTTLSAQRSAPVEGGWGYRVAATAGETNLLEGRVSYDTDIGRAHAAAVATDSGKTLELGAAGGVAVVDGNVFLSPPIHGSFVAVHVDGIPDVRVYADNQLVARTDEEGLAFIPNLPPFNTTSIRVENEDLPLDAIYEAPEARVTPALRSGIMLDFPVERRRSLALRAMLPTGDAVPAGAAGEVVGTGQTFVVGLNGLVYLPEVPDEATIEIRWGGGACRLSVARPRGDDPLPDIGQQTCGSRV